MAEAFLLLWNPARYAWDDYDHDYGRFRRGRRVELDWSTGQRRSIPDGSRVYLLKLGAKPRGLAAAGWTVGEVRHQPAKRGRRPNMVAFRVDSMFPQGTPLPLATLERLVPDVNWHPQGGGVVVDEDAAARVDQEIRAFGASAAAGRGRPRSRGGHQLGAEAVYTIATPDRLARAAKHGEPIAEGKRWVKARALMEALPPGTEMPILFADSRDCSRLIAWSVLRDVEVHGARTRYRIGPLYAVPRSRPQDLQRLGSRKRIADNFIRPYVLCETPKFLLKEAEKPRPWAKLASVELEVREGARRLVAHTQRERNQAIVRLLKDQRWIENDGHLPCEICGIDFGETYGAVGDGFIEAHHREPISRAPARGRTTSAEDFALVCSNCHSMLHRGPDFPSVEQLAKRVRRRT
ncbi:MAG: HNH endonuclease [Polyangiaceae bacterium]|nr:HNH endonuclease [Polyangiaceae bacterium]